MKILYITQFFYPERAAAAFRAYDNARIWKNLGHDVTVLTGYPNFPTGKLFNGYKIQMLQEEFIEGIQVFRSKIIIKPNTSKLMRAIAYFSFSFFVFLNMIINYKKISKNYDIVLSTSGTIFTPIPAYFYAKKIRKPFVLELRDITFKQMLATGSSNKDLGYKFIRRLELFLCKKASKIVTVTNGFKKELTDEGINENKIVVIPNGVDAEKLILNTQEVKNNGIIFSYFGAFGNSQNLTKVIDLIKNIKVENIKLILIGDGAEKQKLIEYKRDNNLDFVQIIDSMPQQELERYYQMSDFCLVVLKNNELFKNTIPSKIFQIMARKRPLLFIGPQGEASSIVCEAKAGINLLNINENENLEYLNKYIKEISNKEELNRKKIELGNNGYNYVLKNYNRVDLAKKYIKCLEDLF